VVSEGHATAGEVEDDDSLFTAGEVEEVLSSSASVRSSMARPTDGRSMVSSPMER
tara:strand:+ start:1069 stop:1233 length:165 start_codon:yes stop_codon:yes gene_type:complete